MTPLLSALLLGSALVVQAAPDDKKTAHKAPAKKGGKVVTTKSGLKYEDLVVGKGPSPKSGQTVTVHYTGWLTNGKKFDSSKDRNEPLKFVLRAHQVIEGWDEGVASM
jgi:peptidylprolyl isomerase